MKNGAVPIWNTEVSIATGSSSSGSKNFKQFKNMAFKSVQKLKLNICII